MEVTAKDKQWQQDAAAKSVDNSQAAAEAEAEEEAQEEDTAGEGLRKVAEGERGSRAREMQQSER